jgi:hypothetical protein
MRKNTCTVFLIRVYSLVCNKNRLCIDWPKGSRPLSTSTGDERRETFVKKCNLWPNPFLSRFKSLIFGEHWFSFKSAPESFHFAKSKVFGFFVFAFSLSRFCQSFCLFKIFLNALYHSCAVISFSLHPWNKDITPLRENLLKVIVGLFYECFVAIISWVY